MIRLKKYQKLLLTIYLLLVLHTMAFIFLLFHYASQA